MSLIPQGPFDLRVEPGQVEITLDESLFGPGRFVFDRARNVVERDAKVLFPLDQIAGVEVQSMWTGPDQPYSFLCVVTSAGSRKTNVCLHLDKARVAEAAEAIGSLAGVSVQYREQPFQRQVRELMGGVDGQPGPLAQGARVMSGCAVIGKLLFLLAFMAFGTFAFGTTLAQPSTPPFVLVATALFAVVPGVMILLTLRGLVRGPRRGTVPTHAPAPGGAPLSAPAPASLLQPTAPLNIRALLKRSPAFWFGVILSAIGLGLLAGSLMNLVTEVRYTVEGEVADGVVVERRRASGRSTSYYATIRFTPPDGLDVVDEERVNSARWQALVLGGPVRVSYLRSNPRENRLLGESSWGEVFSLLGFGAVFGGVGGFFSWRAIRNIRLWRRLLREGVTAEGTVVEVAPTGVKVNREPRYAIRYEYRDGGGAAQRGKSHLLTPEEAELWRVGDVGEIRYDPRRPDQSMWMDTPVTRTAEEPGEGRAPSAGPPAAQVGDASDVAGRAPDSVGIGPPILGGEGSDSRRAESAAAHLAILTGPMAGKQAALSESPSVIGRSIAVEVVVDGDMKVGYQHARLMRGEQGWTVEDVPGSGGTWVNGERLGEPRDLRSGDVIRVGATELRFEAGGED